MTDEGELARRLAAGDDEALESLLTSHLPALHGFVRLHTGPALRDREETVDLVQSVCREVLQHKQRFTHAGERGFKRWLYRTALRKIANRAEYWRASKRDAARAPQGALSADELAACYDSIATPSREVAALELVGRIEGAFDRLPAAQREVVVMSRIAGLKHAEIAQELGKTEVAVRTQLSRGLARLAELLDEDSED